MSQDPGNIHIMFLSGHDLRLEFLHTSQDVTDLVIVKRAKLVRTPLQDQGERVEVLVIFLGGLPE